MSDSFVLCPKCGEELEAYEPYVGKIYPCPNCGIYWNENKVRKVTTEYLKGEEDA